MTKTTEILLGTIILGGLATIVYLKVKQAKAGTKASDTVSSGNNTNAPSASQPATPTPPTPPAPPAPPDPRVGKIAYAKFDGVSVFNADNSQYKTAAKGDWIGTVSSVSAGKIFVEGNSRYVWDTTVPSVTTNFSGRSK